MTTEKNARNARILSTIIENHRANGVPESILREFRTEAEQSGYELDSKEGTAWWTGRSILAIWYAKKNAEEVKAATVEFWWDYEDCGEEGLIRSVYVSGIEIEGLQEYAQDNGLAATRGYVKKLAKKAQKLFKDVTDDSLSRDYARDRMIFWNEYRKI